VGTPDTSDEEVRVIPQVPKGNVEVRLKNPKLRRLHLQCSERWGSDLLATVLAQAGSATSFIAGLDFRHGSKRNEREALALARMIDLTLDEFENTHGLMPTNLDFLEVMLRRFFAVVQAETDAGSWELATLIEETPDGVCIPTKFYSRLKKMSKQKIELRAPPRTYPNSKADKGKAKMDGNRPRVRLDVAPPGAMP
jgi:hypothetical protein